MALRKFALLYMAVKRIRDFKNFSANGEYHTWIQRICELRSGQIIMQVRNFVWLVGVSAKNYIPIGSYLASYEMFQ